VLRRQLALRITVADTGAPRDIGDRAEEGTTEQLTVTHDGEVVGVDDVCHRCRNRRCELELAPRWNELVVGVHEHRGGDVDVPDPRLS
jgi:hypothetical protein